MAPVIWRQSLNHADYWVPHDLQTQPCSPFQRAASAWRALPWARCTLGRQDGGQEERLRFVYSCLAVATRAPLQISDIKITLKCPCSVESSNLIISKAQGYPNVRYAANMCAYRTIMNEICLTTDSSVTAAVSVGTCTREPPAGYQCNIPAT